MNKVNNAGFEENNDFRRDVIGQLEELMGV
jgi:hypothetical protein